MNIHTSISKKVAWNKGKLIGQKRPFKIKEIWAIRVHLELANNVRELALFNLAIDSKLRASDLVRLKINDICHGSEISKRAMVLQKKTKQAVQFEITEQARNSLKLWIDSKNLVSNDFLFPSRIKSSRHLSTRQYARIVNKWVVIIGLDPADYGTHSLRRTKVTLIYRKTKNLRAIQLLLGHSKLESTVRYLGIEVDDALEMAEQTEV
ncbi:MAG: tyrosine-type recombinase/integrase [Methylococcales bacterium]|jgi:integrase|nr:tyrosine-type recombinase/integrase [Methylococcales bacterium]MBT7442782.1 tyrosine-type recombinase/integrase [Methylococcales bacterium]